MFNSLKSILSLVVGTFIVILVIVIVVSLGNKEAKQTPKPIQNIGTITNVDKNNNNDTDNEINNDGLEPIEDNTNEEEDNLEMIDTPDTASKNTVSIIIGSLILSSGILIIRKNCN